MSQWMVWVLLSWITGSPLTALLVLLAIWWLGDRATFRLLPDPLRPFARGRRMSELRRTLAANPHDRRARLELANLLLDARRPGDAAELVRLNVEAGDDDVHTTYAMGAALARSGAFDRAEPFLAAARARDPSFRLGEIDLELGRMRLRKGDAAGAVEPLARLVAERPGTVEGRFWLARALEAQGDAAGAARARDDAWREYASLPRFRRAVERPFAWRIRPWRPALVAAVVVVVVVVMLRAFAAASPGGRPGHAWNGDPAAATEARMDATKRRTLKAELAGAAEPRLVPAERFFDGNGDLGSIGCNLAPHPGIAAFRDVLARVAGRPDVRSVSVVIHELDPGEESWPYAELVLVAGDIGEGDLRRELRPLRPDEIGPASAYGVPADALARLGPRVVAAWWD